MTEIERLIIQSGLGKQLAIAALTIVASSFFVSFGILVRYSIDNPESFNSLLGLATFCGLFLVIRIAMPVIYAVIEMLTHSYCIYLEGKLRVLYFARMSTIYIESLEGGSKSEMIAIYESAMSSVSGYIRTLWGDTLPVLFQTLFIVGSVSYYLDNAIAGVFLLVIGFYVFVVLKMTNARFPLMRSVAISQKKMTAMIYELFAAGLSSKIFGSAHRSSKKYEVTIDDYNKCQKGIQSAFFKFGIVTTLVSVLGSALVLTGVAVRYSEGLVTLGSLVMLATFLFQVFLPLNRIGVLWRTFNKARIDFNLFEETIDRQEKHLSWVTTALPLSDISQIELRQVSKAKGNKTILRDVSEKIDFTRSLPTFITGINGSGKTTLARLICGVDKPDFGDICFDGISRKVDEYGVAANWIALSSQSFTFIDETVSGNVKLLLGDFDKSHYESLAREFGFGKDCGFRVGEQGRYLSSGERHKLSIIIAILKKPKLLIMDEPTVNLDKASIESLKKIIHDLSIYTSVLIVTHDQDLLGHFGGAPLFEITQGVIEKSNKAKEVGLL